MTSDGVVHAGVRDLPRLTSLRWHAALLVFFFHLSNLIVWKPLKVWNWGQAGVSFFFVLSGFVLTWSMRPGPAKDFWWRRFARIYPAHLVATLAFLVLVFAVPSLHGGNTGGWRLLACLLLVQAWFARGSVVYSYNGPSWSLSCEAFFYALFPLLHRGLARLSTCALASVTVIVVVAGALVTGCLSYVGQGSESAYSNPAVRLPEFVLGVTLGLLAQRGFRLAWPVAPLIVTALVVGLVASRKLPLYPLFSFALLPIFALLIFASASADLDEREGLLTHPLSLYLGRVSFSFYLVHQATSLAVLQALGWRHSWSSATGVVPLAVAFTASFVVAMALHHLVEVPGQRWLSRVRSPRSSRAVTASF